MSVTTTLERLPDRLEPSRAANLMLWVIGGFVVLFILWAALARVDEVSRAQGRVIPSRQLQVVSNLEGGIVREILVRQGQKVEKGQPLIQLDATQFSAQFTKEQEAYNALVARITRLQAEVDGTAPIFPAGLSTAAPALVAAERSLYEARRSELAAALSVARSKLDQAQVAVATNAQAKSLADRELALIGPLVEKGIEPQIALLRAQSAAAQAGGDYRAAQSAVVEAASELRSVQQAFKAKAVDDLTTAKAELAAMGRELPALQDRVIRTEVRAPISGTVNRVLVNTIGGVVKPGEPLVEIVPSDDALVVEARVSPADIAFVRPEQRAQVKLTAYDYAIYGSLEGEVERISPDAVVTDEKTGETHYLVRIRTDESLRDDSGRPLSITPGMVAEVDILGDKRSILSYILSPIDRVGSKALRER
jgi:membrane fusion protein, adhesin transport system